MQVTFKFDKYEFQTTLPVSDGLQTVESAKKLIEKSTAIQIDEKELVLLRLNLLHAALVVEVAEIKLEEALIRERKMLKTGENALDKFLNSEHVEINQYSVCPLKTFAQAFSDFCDKKGYPLPQSFSPDYYASIFDYCVPILESHGLSVTKERKTGNYRGKQFVDFEITGLDFACEQM